MKYRQLLLPLVGLTFLLSHAISVPLNNAPTPAASPSVEDPAAAAPKVLKEQGNVNSGNKPPSPEEDTHPGGPPSKQNQPPNPADVNAQPVQKKQKQEVTYFINLAEDPACKADVERMCGKPETTADANNDQKRIQHNFEVLECFMNYDGDTVPSAACQTVVVEYKTSITKDARFDEAAKNVCKAFIESAKIDQQCTNTKPGTFLPCLIEHAYDVGGDEQEHGGCYKFLNKMEMVIFSDYHLVHDFLNECTGDIKQFQCGRIFDDRTPDTGNKEDVIPEQHGQGSTIACLEEHSADLNPKCKQEIMVLAELQADDYHLDRPLYFACKHDRKVLCDGVKSGQGKVYQCLMDNQNNPKISEKCRTELIRREKMMQEDIKVDKGFYKACQPALEKYGCALQPEHPDAHIAMSKALMCLRDADGALEDKHKFVPSKDCVNEITAFQKLMMTEYQISPEIVANCHKDIESHCEGMRGADRQDGTIHCLMGLAMPSRNAGEKNEKFESKLSNECMASLSELLEEADVDEHNSVDTFLLEQCNEEIRTHCANDKENPVDCLMDKIEDGTLDQDNECVKHILELQYFVSRNFHMDHNLARACKDDIEALKLHHELKKNEAGADAGGLVVGQLWKVVREQLRHENNPDENAPKPLDYPVSNKCIKEVLRTVHQRAVNIDLMPEIEDACLNVLTSLCADAGPGHEMRCLQDKYDMMDEKHKECKDLIGQYIEDQDADAKLDYILMKSCEPSVKKYCATALRDVERGMIDDGAIIECLIDNKFQQDMDAKCYAGIEHHQLVNMKSYNFNTKFREACKRDYEKYCVHVTNRVDVILCLSEHVKNDTLLDDEHRISEGCRKQLTAESLKWEESVHLDPKFQEACGKSLKTYCDGVKAGPGEDHIEAHLRCLRNVGINKLQGSEPQCADYVFKQVEANNRLAGAGAMLFRSCEPDIQRLCENHDNPDDLLNCLDENYDQLSHKCQKALDEEEQEDMEDYRLNPALVDYCRSDIKQFCQHVVDSGSTADTHSLQGQVIECLRMEYAKGERSRLTKSCTNQMHLLAVRVHTRGVGQDYVLTHECTKEIAECSTSSGKAKTAKEIIDCLKEKLFKGELRDDLKCQNEVFRLITENRVDIQTDPELYDACRTDLASTACGSLPAGGGRVMACLLSLYDANTIRDPHCRATISNRKDLWQKAGKYSAPESLAELWENVSASSSKWYFISVVLAVIFVIMIVGVLCGRWTKRVAAEVKGAHNGRLMLVSDVSERSLLLADSK